VTTRSRWPRLGIRTQLFGLMLLLVLTGGGVLLLDEVSQAQSERALRGLVEGPLASLRRIKAMSDAYSHDLLATAYKARDGQIGLAQAQRLGEDALGRIDAHWQALSAQPRGPEQQSLMVQIAQARVDADRASRELLNALRSSDREAIQLLCERALAPAIDPVILRLRFLGDLEIIGAENVLREQQARGQRNSALRVGLSLFTLAVVLLVGVRLAGNLVRGIEGLDLMARRLLERDFSEQPVQRPDGELGDVVDAFNAMRAELLRYGGELRASELRANAANRAKSAFLATMSHELRTPMIGVTGMVEVMAHTRLDEDQRRALAMIRHSADNLLQIIGDILDFSKIEAGKLDLAAAALDLRRLVETAVLNFVAAASSKGLSLDCRIDPRLAPAYRADALRLRQILGNFLSNAIKFTEHGGVHVSVELLQHGDRCDRLALAVSDTGIGIAQELQGQLFDPFTQAETSTTRRFGGSGLGLAICARLAELMGAVISLDSREGEGTTLRLELDLHHASPAELAAEAEGVAAQPLQHRVLPTPDDAEAERSLVLLVDDHPTNRLVVTRQLALAGFRSEACNDGAQGLAAWRSGRFALVLTDLHMPVMDGYQLAAEIRAEEARSGAPRTPIIALTAAVMKGEAERCIEAGMDDYLTKPASIATLVQRLHHWLPHLQTAAAVPATPIEASAIEAVNHSGEAVLRSFDPEVLISILGPAPDQLRIVLDDFITAARADLAAVQAAATRDDRASVAREAHKLKGASALAGAPALQAQADRIEAEARAMTAIELDHAVAVLALRLAEFEAATERARLAASAP
jgi:signal transduction histidine kinase/CheY-like chemotaxis protein/HPt (histidine-containing phosphotransfer) domain-containing protein